MTTPNFAATSQHFASRLAAEHLELAKAWLERLDTLLDVDKRDVFPSHQLLDHIPDLLREIAAYLRAPADHEIAANTAVMAKASELGLLRFDQQASVHQLLREYQLLSEVLDGFFAREAALLGDRADATAALLAAARSQQAVRELQRMTVDAFIARYTETIERQHEQLRGFGRLVSHEIRQPLGVLEVLSRLIVPQGGPEGEKLAETLQRNVTRLGDVAVKLERLARLSRRSDAAPNEQRVELTTICGDVARQLADMADVRSVRFDIEQTLPALHVDAGRVELVFMNLMANAVKYSDPDKADRVVRVWVDRSSVPWRVMVDDNGLGIPAHRQPLIFEEFVRAHSERDQELGAQGLGLGLAIVRECMDAMGGTVLVTSEEGKGTSFALAWPRTALVESREKPTATPSTPVVEPQSGGRDA
jgi:signal transduction histidine kinase